MNKIYKHVTLENIQFNRDGIAYVELFDIPVVIIKEGHQVNGFISICSHKYIAMTNNLQKKDGCLVCPYHYVLFDIKSGLVKDCKEKEVPEGLISVPVNAIDDETFDVILTKDHREYIRYCHDTKLKRRANLEASRATLNNRKQ